MGMVRKCAGAGSKVLGAELGRATHLPSGSDHIRWEESALGGLSDHCEP